MYYYANIWKCCLLPYLSRILFVSLVAINTVSSALDIEAQETKTSSVHFCIKNPQLLKAAALEGDLVSIPIQKHSYEISEARFKRLERLVLCGDGTAEDWIEVGLAYRYGVSKFLPQINAEALKIFLRVASIEENISAIFHIACMFADNILTGYGQEVKSVLAKAEDLAVQRNAEYLTVMLEIDQQTDNPALSHFEYKAALRRIIGSAPNARAYIALAESIDQGFYCWSALRCYQSVLALEPSNIEALIGAGVTVSNGNNNNAHFPPETPSALSYFSQAYKLNKIAAGNYYGSALYEQAALTTDHEQAKTDFAAALKILEENVSHEQDALLSLADYHATDHPAKPTKFAQSLAHLRIYMKYKYVNAPAVFEVVQTLKASMVRLEREHSSLFGKIIQFEQKWFSET